MCTVASVHLTQATLPALRLAARAQTKWERAIGFAKFGTARGPAKDRGRSGYMAMVGLGLQGLTGPSFNYSPLTDAMDADAALWCALHSIIMDKVEAWVAPGLAAARSAFTLVTTDALQSNGAPVSGVFPGTTVSTGRVGLAHACGLVLREACSYCFACAASSSS